MTQLITDLAFILAVSAPLIFATMGATIGERAGVINLSLDGTILLAAMVGFAAALTTNSVIVGFGAAALVGALVALVLCLLSLTLGQSQTAVGFVLALLCTDLSSFLGAPFVRVQGPAMPPQPLPLLADIPILGPLFFNHNLMIYASFLLVPAVWWWLFGTRAGLNLRALGERPSAAFARGINVTRMRFLYVMLGGALVGLAGAAYSLDIQRGWSYRHTFGTGWIALAIVIFGGWNPWRVALGCYLFAALQTYAIRSQAVFPNLPTQIFQVAPFALMIFVLALVNSTSNPAVARWVARLPARMRQPAQWIINRLAAPAPAALGEPFRQP
ncbi:MAG: ABC transporter permease [Chloroflexaceae bacterium]|nr:ABC transporter permease [Chloroflexaceae bacterium]